MIIDGKEDGRFQVLIANQYIMPNEGFWHCALCGWNIRHDVEGCDVACIHHFKLTHYAIYCSLDIGKRLTAVLEGVLHDD